jgi:HlyD family secretion protein
MTMFVKKFLSWRGLAALVTVAGGVWAVTAFSQTSNSTDTKKNERAPARTVVAKRATIERTIRVTGTTSAREFASIAAPVMRAPDAGRGLVLMNLIASGTAVKKGDVVAQIDAQAVLDHIDDISASIIQAESDVKKRRAEQAIDWENLQQSIRVTKSEMEKAKLDASAAEIRTDVDREILKLSVEEAEAKYKQQLADLKTQQRAFDSEIKILEITLQRHRNHRERHQADVQKFTLRAPMDGLAVMQTIYRRGQMGQIQEGDEVSPGQPFMRVVNLASMQVDASVSQTESEDLRLNQDVKVHFDAFPDLVLKGKVFSVGAIATAGFRSSGQYVRTIPVHLSFDNTDPRVIPDLTVSGDVTLERKANVITLPLEAIHEGKGGTSVVYVWKGDQTEMRKVKLGITSATTAEIVEGVNAGDVVLLSAPVAQPVTT